MNSADAFSDAFALLSRRPLDHLVTGQPAVVVLLTYLTDYYVFVNMHFRRRRFSTGVCT